MLSDYDKANVGEIVMGHGDWFNANLLRLISKADPGNVEKLRQVYPDEVATYESWNEDLRSQGR